MAPTTALVSTALPDGSVGDALGISRAAGSAFRLPDFALSDGEYTLSFWAKTLKDNMMLEVRVLGMTFRDVVPCKWTRFSHTISSVRKNYIDFCPATNETLMLFEAQLEHGTMSTDWHPAPEDTDEEFLKVESEIVQTAKEIKIMVMEVDDKVSTNQSSISVLKNQILTKVEQSDYNGSNIVSMINQTAKSVTISAQHIKLEGIVTANDNFKVLEDGSIIATNASVTGTINANGGYIGAWSINSDAIYNGNASFGGGGLYFGKSGISLGSQFSVTSGGFLKAVNADLSGNINAPSGTIGGTNGFTIATGKLYSGTHSAYNTATNGVYVGTDYISLGSGGVSWLKNDGTFQLGGANGIKYSNNSVTFGSNVTLSWNNVSNKPTIPTVPSGILTTSNYTTTITKDYIGTLKVVAGSVAAENITGSTITGKTFNGCTGDFTGKVIATSGYIGGTTGWRITQNVIRSVRKINGYYYDYFVQSPNGDTTTNTFAVRRTTQSPISGSSSADWVFQYDTGSTWDYTFRVSKTGDTHVNNLYVNNTQVTSDKKLKNHLQYMEDDIKRAEQFVYGLRPAVYMYNNASTVDDRTYMGFYAQDVYSLLNDVYGCSERFGLTTATTENGDIADLTDNVDDSRLRWTLSYVGLLAPMVAVLQKQMTDIISLRRDVEALSERIRRKENESHG